VLFAHRVAWSGLSSAAGWPAPPGEHRTPARISRLGSSAVNGQVITGLGVQLLAAHFCTQGTSRATRGSADSLASVAAENIPGRRSASGAAAAQSAGCG
jgi:hypothetical protein